PRVKDYVSTLIVPSLKKSRPEYSYEVYAKETRKSIATCLKDKPPVAISKGNDFLEFYGRKIPLSEWHLALQQPPRPTELL
ncbi:MAG: hypothetical protein JNM63_09870, partial [Spirochaetia bacterium]|nr:hypothetical protein [Spirochaetia bacterium]